ncbi:MAG: class I SAM-dependent methyltransferase [Planctomycetaceae bacterium]|nr:class I SAM-dependent methyltransferase [Planctomycetaceae bacterium]
MNNTADFYDIRGNNCFEKNNLQYGIESFKPHVRTPYIYRKLQQFKSITDLKTIRLVDLCCGTATHSIALAKMGFNVVGIDISPKSIEFARYLAKQHKVDAQTSFICEDLNNWLSNAQEKFDIAFMSGSLHYFDRNYFFTKLIEHLNCGGMFTCVETFGGNHLMNFRRKIIASLKPNFRDSITLDGLLKYKEIVNFKQYFDHTEIRFFDFSTLIGVFLPSIIYPLQLTQKIDSVLLNTFYMRSLAWKYVFCGRIN